MAVPTLFSQGMRVRPSRSTFIHIRQPRAFHNTGPGYLGGALAATTARMTANLVVRQILSNQAFADLGQLFQLQIQTSNNLGPFFVIGGHSFCKFTTVFDSESGPSILQCFNEPRVTLQCREKVTPPI